MKKIKFAIFISLALGLSTGCKKDLLDIPNQNDPNRAKVIANGTDIENLASGLFSTIYNGEHRASGVNPMLAVASDNVSCSWGNFGMRDMSYEPRDNGWNNSPAYGNKSNTDYTYSKMYSAISVAITILKAIEGGIKIGDAGAGNNRVKAIAKFAQGVGYGNLALLYDRAFLVDEKSTVEGKLESAITFDKIAAAAIIYLDEAIALCNSTFTIPKTWLGTAGDISNTQLKAICNTMAARILSYLPRNKTQLAAVNWNKVKAYADAGITDDFNVIGDNRVTWYDEAGYYLTLNGWGVTDMYVVNLMDPLQPQHWDDDFNFKQPAPSANPLDKRLNSDFKYLNSNWFLAARGYYHYSTYRSSRYDADYINADAPKAEVMKSENDMLRAEARIYTGDLVGAATIINAGTRTTRGKMPAVLPVLDNLIKAIHHERHVEMYTTSVGLQFFEMRKLNLLQKGTPLHLPIPATTLETLSVTPPFYTFGYLNKADGIGTSNGGWR